jgi:GTP-binding protein
MIIKNAEFTISAVGPKQYPTDNLPEIALAGRSNVGKSSMINKFINRKNLARTSSKPGKRQTLNYYKINNDQFYFVDLPGYGYAKVSQAEKERWGKLMEQYFASERIDLGVFIVDARHAPTNNDITMARWFLDTGCPFVVVANKLDKVKKSELLGNLQTIRDDLNLPEECQIIPFSAEKGTGRDELVSIILETVEK